MASRRCEHFTAVGAPVDPDVKRSTISEDGSGSSSGSLEEIAGEFRQLFPRERSSTTRIRSASTPVSSAASVRRPASSVTISWQSVCVMSRASSPPRRGGSMTTTVDDLFLPEPEPREVRYTVISVDDHLVEPADMFEGRLPSDLQGRAPKIIVDEWGHEVWEFDGQIYSQVGMNAVAGRRPE